MKKIILAISVYLFNTVAILAQEIAPAPNDKAVVYFVRVSSLGFAINFSYFDSARLIGKFNGPKYIRYECEPGSHLFWARSENRDFMEAEVEAVKIYFVEAVPQLGGLKAGVQLLPVDPADEKRMRKIMKLLNKKSSESFTGEELAQETKEMEDIIARGLEKYKEEKEKGKKTERLEKSMDYKTQK